MEEKWLGPLGLGLTLLAAVLLGAEVGEADGTALMARVDARLQGADQQSRSTWRLVNRSGRERVRITRSYWRDRRGADDGLRSQRLIVFEEPSAIRDTAFLVWSQIDSDADDHRWIYLPALRKTRRVAGGDRGNSFVGTDFSYEDLAEREVEEDEHRLLRSEELNGVLHEVVESTPRSPDDPYSRRIHWVNPEGWTLSRIEYYDRKGQPEKTLDVEWQDVAGFQTWKRLEMVSRKGHRTIVEIEDLAWNVGLGDEIFNKGSLRR